MKTMNQTETNRHYEHTYGARKTWNKGEPCFCVHVDGKPTSLYYKRYEKTVGAALSFARAMYKGGWKDIQGFMVSHSFNHVDIV